MKINNELKMLLKEKHKALYKHRGLSIINLNISEVLTNINV